MYAVVIPNRFEDVIRPLLASIVRKIPAPFRAGIIMDGHTRDYGYLGLPYDDPHFSFARAVNIGIQAFQGQDIVLLNDDCVVLEWNFFDRLAQLAYADPMIGILSPLIVGCVGNPVQRWHEQCMYWTPEMDFIDVPAPSPVCFPCVYIKRQVFETAGLLNERIAGYGRDDVEFCQATRAAGWKTVVTQRLLIQHADGSPAVGEGRGKSWATSFMRRWPNSGAPSQQEINAYLLRRTQES
jgi:hypothetical protein